MPVTNNENKYIAINTIKDLRKSLTTNIQGICMYNLQHFTEIK